MKNSNGKGTVFMMSNLDHYNGGAFADLKTALKSVCERLDFARPYMTDSQRKSVDAMLHDSLS